MDEEGRSLPVDSVYPLKPSSETQSFSNPSVVKESGCSSAPTVPHNVNCTVLHQQPYFGSWPTPSTGVAMSTPTWQHGIHELNYGVLHQQPYFGSWPSMPYNTAPSTGVAMSAPTWQHGIHELNYGGNVMDRGDGCYQIHELASQFGMRSSENGNSSKHGFLNMQFPTMAHIAATMEVRDSWMGAFNGVGSFRELMMTAQSGAMQFDIFRNQVNTSNFAAQTGAMHFDGDNDEEGVGAGDNDEEGVGEGNNDDEGYLGGQECVGDENNDEEGYLGSNDDEVYRVDDDLGDQDERFDDDLGGNETGSDDECAGGPDHLGDCGCVTGENHEIDSDDVEYLSSDSDDENDEEEEFVIEVDLTQEFYINKAQEGVPYRKRKRVQKSVKRPNCRKPRMMGAIERALRSAPSRKEGEYVFQPKLGMVFDSRVEAREFYNMYSWEKGFGIKYNSSKGPASSSRSKGKQKVGEEDEPYISMQEIVCQKSGHDSRITTGTKRSGCPAKIRLLRTDDYGWYISTYVEDHNHEFAKTPGERREWNSHRQIEPEMKKMIKHLRLNNVPLTKVHCIMSDMYGSKGDVQWTRRSLRTICNQITKDQIGDDMRKTMEKFRDMYESDPGFQFSVELDKSSRVRTLIWCSGRGREQYACFGDVVTFDTTYCTNIYKMPFGLFVGVNHHFQTTIFAGVLMRRETAKSFKWVFSEFLKLMGGKAPQTILTDQCKAMAKALRFVMPNTYHLWCKWHVMKIRECLGPLYTKNKKFRAEFGLVVNGMLTEDEFEGAWADLVKRYQLEENAFMKRIYKSKKKWAKPWSKDKFCARMSSTQRSESANFMLKQFVPRNASMNHFVSQYSRLLYEREREEDNAEDKTKQLNMVHSRLWSIESHALKVYTKAAFELFRSEVDKASKYRESSRDGNTYTISHENAAIRAQWARVHFKVQVEENEGGKKFICECGLYEHFGILCCHDIRLMQRLQLVEIPSAHIMKRWTRDARDVLPSELKKYQKDHASMNSNTFRDRLMDFESVKLKARASGDFEMFEILMKHMKAAEKESNELIAKRLKNKEILQDDDSSDEELVGKFSDAAGAQSDGGILRTKKRAGRPDGVMLEKNTITGKSGGVRTGEPDGGLVRNNKYGASGSSAHFSDSEIIGMKAPYFKRKEGRPRQNRFHAGSEYKKKKWQKKNSKKDDRGQSIGDALGDLEMQPDNDTNDSGKTSKKKKKASKREIKCGKCSLLGHNATQCCTLEINEQTAPSYF